MYSTHTSQFHRLHISKAWWPRGSWRETTVLGTAGLAGPHSPPELGDCFFCPPFFFCWWPFGGQGKGCFPWRIWPPAALGAERMGVEAGSFQDEGGLLQRVLCLLPDARGTGTKGWLQGTIVGRLVTVPGSGRADRAPCVCAWPGWALQPLFPCWLLIPACGLLSGPLPTG